MVTFGAENVTHPGLLGLAQAPRTEIVGLAPTVTLRHEKKPSSSTPAPTGSIGQVTLDSGIVHRRINASNRLPQLGQVRP